MEMRPLLPTLQKKDYKRIKIVWQKLDNLIIHLEMERLLKRHQLPKLTQKKKENLNRYIRKK